LSFRGERAKGINTCPRWERQQPAGGKNRGQGEGGGEAKIEHNTMGEQSFVKKGSWGGLDTRNVCPIGGESKGVIGSEGARFITWDHAKKT